MRAILSVLFAVCLVTEVAYAQEANPAVTPIKEEKEKSGAAAFGLSFGGTMLGVGSTVLAVVVLGGEEINLGQTAIFSVLGLGLLTVGPSFGHIYSGATTHAVALTGARLLAFGVPFILDQRAIAQQDPNAGNLTAVSSLVVSGLIIYDWIDAPLSVRRAKRKAEKSAFQLTPVMLPTQSGARATGAMATFQF